MRPYLALKASAGSGKTFALSVRYISLLFLDVNPSTILTLTFTNKAALEMSERIFKTLIELGEDEIILNEIIKETMISKENILEKKEKVIQRYLQSELSILTLDKFMNKVLREFSGYLGLGDDFTIVNNDHDFLLYKFLLSLDFTHFDLLISFASVHNTNLKSIINLFAILDEKNESYEYFDFKEELLALFKENVLQEARTIKKAVENIDLSKSAMNAVKFETIEELMTKTWIGKDSLLEYQYFKKAKEKISVYDINLQELKKQLRYFVQYGEHGKLNKLFQIFNYYRDFRLQYKKEKNQLKFTDVTNFVYELLEHHIHKDFLYFRLDNRYEHIMIDEFQDTSVLQFKILKPLIDEIFSGDNEVQKTFFYVGDTKQSIYRFRGGKKELFDYVYTNYTPLLELDSLSTNYRSAQNIVEFTNEVFLAQSKYEYEEQFVHSDIKGYVEVSTLDMDNEPYESVKLKVEDLLSYGICSDDIAILTYTNDDVLGIYEYLKKAFPKMKMVTDMTSKLIKQKNVKALINAIKYLYFKENIYLSNFNTILSFETLKPFEFNMNIETNSLLDILYALSNKYKLIDENVIKFLEVVESYGDIVEFVYEIDNEESSMVSKETKGLQILTIFKSKGLEYNSVILLDRIKAKVSDKSKLLFSYNEVELNKIFFKNKNRVAFDDEYKKIIEDEQEQTVNDELNILYVAITRAKYNLFILKKEEKSVFDLLEFPLTNHKQGEIYTSLKTLDVQDNIHEIVEYEPKMIGSQNIDKKTILDDSENLKSRYFGLATHYCLEMMKSFDTVSLEYAIRLTKAKYNVWLDELIFKDLFKRIELLIDDKRFKAFTYGNTCYKEQMFTYNGELKIIDLLIDTKDKLIIIDYKTTNEILDSHKKQVQFYEKALKDITKKDVDTYLVYLKQESIEIIPV